MRVRIDTARCQGHNRCLSVDSTRFDADELGFAFVVGDGLVPAGEEEAVQLAALNCPERAIHIEDT
jgi:ferredoxin